MTGKAQKEKKERPSELQKMTSSYRSGWAYSEIALQYGLAIVICALIGYWLDSVFGTGPVIMITGVMFGAAAGFMGMLRSLGVLKFKKKRNDGKVQ